MNHKLVDELAFLEQFSVIQSYSKQQLEMLDCAGEALEQSAMVCVEFVHKDLIGMLSTTIATASKFQSWSRDFIERIGAMEKMIHRVLDIISPIKDVSSILLEMFKNYVDVAVHFQKIWINHFQNFCSTVEPYSFPLKALVHSIGELVNGFGGYFVEEAFVVLLERLLQSLKESVDDAFVLAGIVKIMLQYFNPSKCIRV